MRLRSTPAPPPTRRGRAAKAAPPTRSNRPKPAAAPPAKKSAPRATPAAAVMQRRLRTNTTPVTPPDSPKDTTTTTTTSAEESRLRKKENGMVMLPRTHYNRHPGRTTSTTTTTTTPLQPRTKKDKTTTVRQDALTVDAIAAMVDRSCLPSPEWDFTKSQDAIAAELEALTGETPATETTRRVDFSRRVNDECDRLVALSERMDYTITIDGQRVDLLGAPDKIADMDDLKILLQIVHDSHLASFNVTLKS